jgi:uncharacterized glyoxalase superfamily metalloenzyme YdcJ
LRQTSFKALEEPIAFVGDTLSVRGTHTARFGEIEQRGVALTAKGRVLYDQLLASVRGEVQVGAGGAKAGAYDDELAARFKALPDSWDALRREELAFFRYFVTPAGVAAAVRGKLPGDPETLIAEGYLGFDPIVYEDFLPVSAAGIFQSNLGTDQQQNYETRSNRAAFETALGGAVQDELALYAKRQAASLVQALDMLGLAGLQLQPVA